jgi:hypothetical protein
MAQIKTVVSNTLPTPKEIYGYTIIIIIIIIIKHAKHLEKQM